MSPKILILSALCAVLFCILGSTSAVLSRQYRGCYKDAVNRDLPHFENKVSNIDECVERCHKDKMKYAGLQYGGECWCGNSYGSHGKSGECSMKCKSGQICGNSLVNSVYLIVVGFAQPEGYVGCFKDGTIRDLAVWVKHVSKIVYCIDLCRERRFPYAGLQHYDQCYCGIDFGNYGKAGHCNLPCKNGGTCGGHWANSIYFVDDKFRRQHKGYLGCYRDEGDRDLGTWGAYVRSMADCKRVCKQKKKRYAGVQAGNQCRCGNKYGKYGKPSAPCTLRCENGDMCGGSWQNSIYVVW